MSATVHLLVGLPAAGKTALARELEQECPALRLTPDEWQIALFDGANPAGKRDLVEGRLILVGLRAAQLGLDVVLDFGLWSRQERAALRWLAARVGARGVVHYLPVDPEEQRHRVLDRFKSAPERTFPMSVEDLTRWRGLFEEPDAQELSGGPLPTVPPPHVSWAGWAARRWPSMTELTGPGDTDVTTTG